MAWFTEVLVNGVDLTPYLTDWKVKRSRDSSDTETAYANFMVAAADAGLLKHGYSITIKRGPTALTADDQFIFRGKITNITNESGIIHCNLRPPHWELQRQVINEVFDNTATEAGDIAEIWKTLAEGENETITVSTQPSTGLPLLEYFVCKGETRWDKCQELRNLIKWQSYYRPDTDTYYLEPEGFTTFPDAFTVGQNIFNDPIWKYDVESIYNDVTVVGAFDDARFQESFDGDTVEDTFILTYVPIDTEVYLNSISQANLQIMGITNSTESFDYSVEKEKSEIIFVTPPGSGTNNVIVNYTYLQQRPVRQKNQTSIGIYGLSMHEVFYDTIINIEDAKIQVQAIINVYSTPFRSTTLLVLGNGTLQPGNRIIVNDTVNNEINRLMTVNTITYQYTAEYDILEVGDKLYKMSDLFIDVIQNIVDLQKANKDNQEIITELSLIEREVILHSTKERYKKALAPDTLYWGDPLVGIWGTDKWGDGSGEVTTLIKRTHTGTVFYDDYKSNHYINVTGSSNVTVNVTNGQLEFTSGGIYLSEAIHIDNTLITQVTPSWNVGSGSVKVEMRTESGFWRELTNGVTAYFSVGESAGATLTSFPYVFPMVFTGGGDERGVQLYYRITENAASTATVTKIQLNINN